MKNKNVIWAVALPFILTFLVVPSAARAALPFTVKSGHPRVYVDPARVATIQDASQQAIPLNGTDFSKYASGTLTFDINPVPRIDATQNINLGIFDQWNSTRNHIFVRHLDQPNPNDPNGNTYCGTSPADQVNLCFQLALQSSVTSIGYIASNNFILTANSWHTLTVSWNSTVHGASLQLDNNAAVPLYWKRDANNVPYEWSPDNQQFVFTGRDTLDNIRLYGSDNSLAGPLLVDYPMNDATGVIVSDVSGYAHNARISTGVTWTTRSASDTDSAIRMDGKTGKLSVIAGNVLTEAWVDFYNNAVSLANQLNTNGNPVDVWYGHPNAIKNVARDLGLAYLVTGEAQFRSAALVFADRLLAVTPRSTGGDYTQAGRIEAMGILYDWLFNDVRSTTNSSGSLYSDALVSAIEETIQYQAPFICGSNNALTADWNCSTLPAYPDFISGHSHQNNTETTAALLAIIDEHPELSNLLGVEYQNFVNGYNPARAWISVDGGHHMGWDYGAAYTFLDSIQLWDTATTDVSMLDTWQGKLIDRYIYALRGDMVYPASGDAFAGGGMTPQNEEVTDFALWAAKYFGNTAAERFYNRWSLPAKSGARFSELLYWEPNLPETPIEQLDFSRWFRNAGQVVMRDSWDYANAALLEFKSASFMSINHQHLDQNAFTIFYKAPLLVDSGYYDSYGTNHWQNYFTRTIAHNTVTVFDPQEQFPRAWTPDYCNGGPSGNLCSNDGGQQFPAIYYPTLQQAQPGGPNALDGVVAYAYSPDFTYVEGNASKAYSSGKLDQSNGFVRSLVFLRTPSFWPHPVTVVFDKITTTADKGSLVKRFLLHSVSEPEPSGGTALGNGQYLMSGNTVTIRNGGGMLFSQTLLPVNPVLTKIGGQDVSGDHRFLVQAQDQYGNYQYQNFPPSPDPGTADADMGAWRIEVTAPVPSQREYFLNVLSIADNGAASAPPSAQNLSSDSTAVALLGNTQLVAFNKNDQTAAQLTWDVPIADVRMIVAGLQPNTVYSGAVSGNGPYTINLYPDQNGQLLASSHGVLTVNSTVVSLGADLSANMTVSPNPVFLGQTATYTIAVTNGGPSSATNVTANGTLPACSFGTLAGGASASCTVMVTASSVGTLTQTMSVTANEVDPNPANNTASASTTVVAPDLVPTAVSAAKYKGAVSVSDALGNQGDGSAGAFTVGYYLSTDTIYDPGTDLALVSTSGIPCARTVDSLNPGDSSSVSNLTCYKPSGVVKGQHYYVLVVEDAANQVIESNESNNVMATTGQVWW